jgi:DNA repair protein RadD
MSAVTDLWDHQTEALAAIRQSVAQGVRRLVVQAPTGSGKTKMAADLIGGAQRKGNRLAFVVSHLALIDQTVEALYREGIKDLGVIQADHHMTDWSQPVQVCSIQTIRARKAYPEASAVIFDECHVLHEAHKTWLKDPEWANVPFIGLSATPWTRGLGKYFDSLLIAATTQDLIDKGLLSKFKVFATGHPDLSRVRVVAGDYHEGELAAAMQEGELTADIIKTWKERHGKDRTFLFAVDRAHAKTLAERFKEAGVECGYQDAFTPPFERAELKRKFHNGEIKVIANIGTLTVGVDWDVRCIILARPTRSEMLFVQIIGRGLRTAPGKEECLILDHSDTTERLGFVTDIFHDHLDDGKPKRKTEASEEKPKPLPKPCPQCDSMQPRKNLTCQNCGHKFQIISGFIERDGELVEIDLKSPAKPSAKAATFTMEQKLTFYRMLIGYAEERGYKSGWAANQYKQKFSVWPRGFGDPAPLEPDLAMRSWIKSRMIAWAKGKARRDAA